MLSCRAKRRGPYPHHSNAPMDRRQRPASHRGMCRATGGRRPTGCTQSDQQRDGPAMIAEAAFWCSVVLVVYAYLGYPCVLKAMTLFRDQRVKKAAIRPRVSFVIAAHNEEQRIAEKIENTLRQ